jgi:GNAT superfamily N-acetyltransferase
MAGKKLQRIYALSDLANNQKTLIEIYQKAFGEKPWYEVFSEQEVADWFAEMMAIPNHIVLTIKNGNKIVGATFCTSMELKPDLYPYLENHAKPEEVIYLAESFIDPAEQHQGYGSILHKVRLALAKQEGWRWALQRTNKKSGMYHLIKRTGFQEIGKQPVVSKKLIKGKVIESSDERILSLKKL